MFDYYLFIFTLKQIMQFTFNCEMVIDVYHFQFGQYRG